MKINVHFLIIFLLGWTLIMSSCSPKRNLATSNQRPNTSKQDEFQAKSVETDSTGRVAETEIIMPPAVDISNYEPAYIKRDKKRKARAKELKLRDNIVHYSKKYLGTPYKYAGRKPSTGFDCSGFTCYIYKHFDLPLSLTSRTQANDGKKIAVKKTQPGDLVIFGSNGKVSHVGIVVENKAEGVFVIHSTNRGVVIDNILKSTYWAPRIMYARTVIGLKR